MTNATHDRWIMVSVFRPANGFGPGYKLHAGYDSFRPEETLGESLRRIAYGIARQGEDVETMAKRATVNVIDGGMIEREVIFN